MTVARVPCLPKVSLVGVMGYEARGVCGYQPPRRERQGEACVDVPAVPSTCVCRFGANEIVEDRHFSRSACPDFRARMLAVYGPGGPRMQVGRGSRASEADTARAQADHQALPGPLEELVIPSRPTLSSRLVEGLRVFLGGRPSETFRKYAASVEAEREAHAAAKRVEEKA